MSDKLFHELKALMETSTKNNYAIHSKKFAEFGLQANGSSKRGHKSVFYYRPNSGHGVQVEHLGKIHDHLISIGYKHKPRPRAEYSGIQYHDFTNGEHHVEIHEHSGKVLKVKHHVNHDPDNIDEIKKNRNTDNFALADLIVQANVPNAHHTHLTNNGYETSSRPGYMGEYNYYHNHVLRHHHVTQMDQHLKKHGFEKKAHATHHHWEHPTTGESVRMGNHASGGHRVAYYPRKSL